MSQESHTKQSADSVKQHVIDSLSSDSVSTEPAMQLGHTVVAQQVPAVASTLAITSPTKQASLLKQPIADYQLSLAPMIKTGGIKDRAIAIDANERLDLGSAIAQCHHRYILAQNEHGLVVVDQHAAHERIIFEKLKAQGMEEGSQQQLLMPEHIPLESFDANLAQPFCVQLKRYQINCKLMATGIELLAVPVLLKKLNIKELLQEAWLTYLHEDGHEQKLDYVIDRLLANMACKAAIKVNHQLTITQMNAVLRSMEVIPYGGICNHGRPAVRFFALDAMDKWFLRGQ